MRESFLHEALVSGYDQSLQAELDDFDFDGDMDLFLFELFFTLQVADL